MVLSDLGKKVNIDIYKNHLIAPDKALRKELLQELLSLQDNTRKFKTYLVVIF